MTELYRSAASLRFFGDDLDPDEITAALGAAPTVGVRKGGVWFTSRGVEKVAPRGSWRLRTPDRENPGGLDAQIVTLLQPLTNDLDVWNELTERYEADVFCGLFLRSGNEGLTLSPRTLGDLGRRGLALDLDIYGSEATDED